MVIIMTGFLTAILPKCAPINGANRMTIVSAHLPNLLSAEAGLSAYTVHCAHTWVCAHINTPNTCPWHVY